MRAQDVRSFKDQRSLSGERSVETILRRGVLAVFCESASDEGFSRGVDGHDNGGMPLFQLRDDGENTFQFFGGSDCGFGILRGILTRVCRLWSGTYIDVRSRASGFSADVKDVGTLVQQTLGLLERLV